MGLSITMFGRKGSAKYKCAISYYQECFMRQQKTKNYLHNLGKRTVQEWQLNI